jgi:hypothetical protein
MPGFAWMNFMKRFPRWTMRKNASRHGADARQRGRASTVFFYPDYEEAVASFQPSAPAFDRIC